MKNNDRKDKDEKKKKKIITANYFFKPLWVPLQIKIKIF